jgi:hypothetical protein
MGGAEDAGGVSAVLDALEMIAALEVLEALEVL